MTKQIHVAIGSKNPCKIDSVKSAFHKVFEKHLSPPLQKGESESDEQGQPKQQPQAAEYELVFTSHNVPSNVSDQPMGDEETLKGAKNRAMAAFEAAQKEYTERKKVFQDKDRNNNNADTNIDCYMVLGPPDFGIGLEGGIEIRSTQSSGGSDNDGNDNDDEAGRQELWCMAWMAIVGTNSAACTLAKHESSTFNGEAADAGSNTNLHSNTNSNHTGTAVDREDCNTNINTNIASSCPLVQFKWGLSKTAAFPLPQKISHLILHENVELGDADDMVFKRVNSKQGSGTVGLLTNHIITRSDYYDHAIVLALISFIWPEHYSFQL
eukprot:CAMPEP_0203668214 /NCGR_PEP_ID=MMETSP0090-20130426/4899_1 /ASSEMBLY_ACC=CAM_ASM_001088 /TAXON_ID=426623 /ORGANISM="Chaetoceros affinis, Strain CCMP159" /LENGTH=323 /DNA_ID=CAMNT_0050532597 /DNA_START=25 /DNA_END=996 /DNA_ORIENTATION=+